MDKIICVGKNYLEHAQELGDAVPEKPVLFIKPPSVLIQVPDFSAAQKVDLVEGRGSVHHECEIVLKVGSHLKISEVSLGLDMTLRDVQKKQKEEGHPWTTSKVFPGSAIVGPWVPVEEFSKWKSTPFEFTLNGNLRQKGSAQQMSLAVDEILAYVQTFFPVREGDLIFTGTPKGVGPVQKNDEAKLSWGKIQYRILWQ